MVLVQRAVGAQVAEGVPGQAEAVADAAGGMGGEGDAGAFEDVDHAEQADRVAAGDEVVEIGHHQLDGQCRAAALHGVCVASAGGDVVENPALVAVLLVDVLADGAAQPLQAGGQARAAGHQQRHGMADMVVGLGQEGDVALQADHAGQRLANHRDAEQRLALAGGGGLQGVEEWHGNHLIR
ncbi:hypothetical protein D9M68_863890 [compost metagenome]